MDEIERIKTERGYSNARLTIEEKQFVRSLLEAARNAGDKRATDRLIRQFDTAFVEARREFELAAA